MEMKNRFYYSFSQECISQKMGEIDDMFNKIEGIRENYVLTPNGWEKYTEWCSQEGSKCNWEDARLIFETNDSPEIKIEYRKTTQLAVKELELILVKNQLKEKEEELEKNDDEWREICDGKLETINRLIEEKHELEETIKNKSHNKWLKSEAEKYKNEYQSLKGYVDQLKQQLAEEKNRSKKLNHEAQKYYEDAYCNNFQNQKAIAELEKVRHILLGHYNQTNYKCIKEICRDIDKQIDQQIKLLKGEK